MDARGALPVPAHIRNATTGLGKSLGWGVGYQYPHDHPGHHVAANYLPDELRGHRYYQPSGEGREKEIAERLETLRAVAKGPDNGKGER